MPLCAVFGCNETGSNDPNIHLHNFPHNNNNNRQIWINRCGRADKFNWKTSQICSHHFEPHDYKRNLKYELLNLPVPSNQIRLKENALPSLSLPYQKRSRSLINSDPEIKDPPVKASNKRRKIALTSGVEKELPDIPHKEMGGCPQPSVSDSSDSTQAIKLEVEEQHSGDSSTDAEGKSLLGVPLVLVKEEQSIDGSGSDSTRTIKVEVEEHPNDPATDVKLAPTPDVTVKEIQSVDQQQSDYNLDHIHPLMKCEVNLDEDLQDDGKAEAMDHSSTENSNFSATENSVENKIKQGVTVTDSQSSQNVVNSSAVTNSQLLSNVGHNLVMTNSPLLQNVGHGFTLVNGQLLQNVGHNLTVPNNPLLQSVGHNLAVPNNQLLQNIGHSIALPNSQLLQSVGHSLAVPNNQLLQNFGHSLALPNNPLLQNVGQSLAVLPNNQLLQNVGHSLALPNNTLLQNVGHNLGVTNGQSSQNVPVTTSSHSTNITSDEKDPVTSTNSAKKLAPLKQKLTLPLKIYSLEEINDLILRNKQLEMRVKKLEKENRLLRRTIDTGKLSADAK